MAIHYAADYGQLEVIEYLVSKGADINVWNITVFGFFLHLSANTLLPYTIW